MQTLTVLPSIGFLSAIVITLFCLFNGFLLLWIYRNWQRSNKKPEIFQKEKYYQEFTDITGYYFIPRERFIYLHSQVITALFNIHRKGVLYFEDWHQLREFIFSHEKLTEFENIPDIIFDNLKLCQKVFQYHQDNKMIFPADKFFQVFFGFGQYYEQVLNENKK